MSGVRAVDCFHSKHSVSRAREHENGIHERVIIKGQGRRAFSEPEEILDFFWIFFDLGGSLALFFSFPSPS